MPPAKLSNLNRPIRPGKCHNSMEPLVFLMENPGQIINTHPEELSIQNEGATARFEATLSPLLKFPDESTIDTVGSTGSQFDKITNQPQSSITDQSAIENEQRIEQLSRRTDSLRIYNGTNIGQKIGNQIEKSDQANQSSNEEPQNSN